MTETCNICCRPSASPFRAYNDDSTIRLGCVDALHNDRLVPISASSSWHNRKEAKAIRKAMSR